MRYCLISNDAPEKFTDEMETRSFYLNEIYERERAA
jgi:hypothetical protein